MVAHNLRDQPAEIIAGISTLIMGIWFCWLPMHCLNKFLISFTPVFLVPNSQVQSSDFGRTQKVYCSRKPYHNISPPETAADKIIPLPSNVKTISSTSNDFVKHCVKLRQSSSYRHLHGSVLVVGETPIREIFSSQTLLDRPVIECLLVLNDYHIPDEFDYSGVRIVHINSGVMSKLSGVQSIDSVKVIALVRIPSTFHVLSDNIHEEEHCKWFSYPYRILVLDGIQDPGNLGTLLRSAAAFRWGGVFLLPGCCDPFNDKALRASRGACFQIQIVSGNWLHLQTLREKFRMKILAGHPTNIETQALSRDFVDSLIDLPLCLVLGSEGGGLSEFTRSACQLVSIPMGGDFESLNVSIAGGIFMYMLQPQPV